MDWLARNNLLPTDALQANMLNSLANDDRNWGGDVNGGGHRLSNVILDGSGGFANYLSPLQITPGADGGSYSQYDQTIPPGSAVPPGVNYVRWIAGKNATPETGANAGSDYEIRRYDDAGALLGTPFSVNRATGLITMGAQHWTGAVDAGGMTLSNVVIPGMLTNPMTAKGDLIAGGAAGVATKLGVGTNGQVLVADSSVAGVGMKWATTDPTTTLGDLIVRGPAAVVRLPRGADGQVLVTDSAVAGFGLKWATAGGSATYLLDDITKGTRPKLNIHTGANAALTLTDDPTNNQVILTIAGTGGGGGGGPQTPWISDINAAGFALDNAGTIRTTGGVTPSAGAGLEFSYQGGVGYVASWDRTANLARPLTVFGDKVQLQASGDLICQGSGGGNFGIGDLAGTTGPGVMFQVLGNTTGYCAAFSGIAPSIYLTPFGGHPNPGVNVAQADAAFISLATAAGQYGMNQGDLMFVTQTRVATAGGNRICFGHPRDNLGNYDFGFYYDHARVGIGVPVSDAILDVSSTAANILRLRGGGATTNNTQLRWYGNAAGADLWALGTDIDGGVGKGFHFYNFANGIVAGIAYNTGYAVFGQAASGAALTTLHAAGASSYPSSEVGTFVVTGGGSQYRLGFGYDAGNEYGWIQSVHNGLAPTNLLLQASGGHVGIGAIIAARSMLTIIAPNPTTPAGANQLTIGEQSNNPQYGLQVGYYMDSATGIYKGVVQSLHANAGNALLLNPNGGSVGVGTTSPYEPLFVTGATGLSSGVGNTSYYRIAPSGDQTALQIGYWVGGAWYGSGGIQLAFGGSVGIGKYPAGFALDVNGNVNITGAYLVNGVPLSTGGGITTQTDMYASRVIHGTYQNTSGKPMFVSVGVLSTAPATTMQAYSDASASPTMGVALCSSGGAAGSMVLSVSFWVLPGNYYKVDTNVYAGVNMWVECH